MRPKRLDLSLRDIRYAITADRFRAVNVMEHVTVGVRDGRIVTIDSGDTGQDARDKRDGKGAALTAPVETIDCSGLIAIPGLVNAHHHLYQSFLRGVGADHDLQGWFAARRPYLAHLGPEERYHAVRLAHLELLNNGTTCVCEFSSNNPSSESIDATIKALATSPLSIVLAYAPPRDRPSSEMAEVLRVTEAFATPRATSGLRRTFLVPAPIVPHVEDRDGVEHFRDLVRRAKAYDMPITTHCLENRSDRAGRPIDVLQQSGALVPGTVLAHGVHLQGEEMQQLADAMVAVVHNPVSNMRLAAGIMPFHIARDAGLRVGLGTDGSANDGADMLETMKIAMGLQRAATCDAGTATVADVFLAGTIDGAAALGIEADTGSIELGKRADIVLLDPRSPHFSVINDPLGQVVLNASAQDCRHIVAGGVVTKRNGQVVGIDSDRLLREAQECFRHFRDRVARTAP